MRTLRVTNRRFVSLFGPLVFLIALSGAAMAQAEILLNNNGLQGVEILASERMAEKHAFAIKASEAQPLLPYSVVIRNTGSEAINGLDVRYEIYKGSDLVVNNFFYGSPDEIASKSSIPVIAPGQEIVISPLHVMNEQLMSNHGISISRRHSDEIARTLALFRAADKIEISIDSIIRADGVLKGPDRARRLENFKSQVSAYSQFRKDLLERLKRGDPDSEVMLWLAKVEDLKVIRPDKNVPLDRGVILRKLLAQEYLAFLKNGQRDQVIDELERATADVKFRQIFKVTGEGGDK